MRAHNRFQFKRIDLTHTGYAIRLFQNVIGTMNLFLFSDRNLFSFQNE